MKNKYCNITKLKKFEILFIFKFFIDVFSKQFEFLNFYKKIFFTFFVSFDEILKIFIDNSQNS